MSRVEYPPHAPHPSNQGTAIISVTLQDNEDVQWNYAYGPNGERYYLGYTIISKPIGRDHA